MRNTACTLRRLIFGMSIEDAHSRFDSVDARRAVQYAHERHNLGILHELKIAQRRRDKLAPERRFHIIRFCKPSVKGFQAYIKDTPDDYVIREIWPDEQGSSDTRVAAPMSLDSGGSSNNPKDRNTSRQVHKNHQHASPSLHPGSSSSSTHRVEGGGHGVNSSHTDLPPGALRVPSTEHSASSLVSTATSLTPPGLSDTAQADKLRREYAQYMTYKGVVLDTLHDALEGLAESVHAELSARRQSGSLVSAVTTSVMAPLYAQHVPNSRRCDRYTEGSRRDYAPGAGGSASYLDDDDDDTPRMPAGRASEADGVARMYAASRAHTAATAPPLSSSSFVVDRLVGEVRAAQEAGYRSLSSSSHLLDPLEMTMTLFERQDRSIAEAFASELLCVPAREGCISYSLWVAGGLLAHLPLCHDFPFHIAKYVVSESEDVALSSHDDGEEEQQEQEQNDDNGDDDDGNEVPQTRRHRASSPTNARRVRHNDSAASHKTRQGATKVNHTSNGRARTNSSRGSGNDSSRVSMASACRALANSSNRSSSIPRVDVEVYFSPELYRLHRVLGSAGVTALRQFIGRAMMRQHEPTATSPSLLLNIVHTAPVTWSPALPIRTSSPVLARRTRGVYDETHRESGTPKANTGSEDERNVSRVSERAEAETAPRSRLANHHAYTSELHDMEDEEEDADEIEPDCFSFGVCDVPHDTIAPNRLVSSSSSSSSNPIEVNSEKPKPHDHAHAVSPSWSQHASHAAHGTAALNGEACTHARNRRQPSRSTTQTGVVGSTQLCLPWHTVVSELPLAHVTGAVRPSPRVGSDVLDAAAIERRREAVMLVWKAWGHLIKDLHVWGDLDCLYLGIDRDKECGENEAYIRELRELSREACDTAEKEQGMREECRDGAAASTSRMLSRVFAPHAHAQAHTYSMTAPSLSGADRPKELTKKQLGRLSTRLSAHATRCVPIAADFVVLECTLERRGLPHRVVMEDMVSALTAMQTHSLEMMRLAVVDQMAEEAAQDDDTEEAEAESNEHKEQPLTSGESVHTGSAVEHRRGRTHARHTRGVRVAPVLYAPRVVVSHAGVLDSATHSFQRIRIRGSSVVHVSELAAALKDGSFLHQRHVFSAVLLSSSGQDNNTHTPAPSPSPSRPKNGSFHFKHASASGAGVEEMAAPADATEVAFWHEHFYRLHDIRLIFHDRVDAETMATATSLENEKELPESGGKRNDDETAVCKNRLGSRTWTGAGSKKKRLAAAGRSSVGGGGVSPANRSTSEERMRIPLAKLFEYRCTEAEAACARHDLRIGDCGRYLYDLTLRRIPSTEAMRVGPAVHSLQRKGFINYIGPRRFGAYTACNMHPGLHLLKGEYRAAAMVLVNQFYLDAAVRRQGESALDAASRGGRAAAWLRRDVSWSTADAPRRGGGAGVEQHGTAMQRVLSNALQASAWLEAEGATEKEGGSGSAIPALDPCAEAFMHVIGPRACSILIHEFLAFVWNDVVNQRLQRYGTFAILPGDLVTDTTAASVHTRYNHHRHDDDDDDDENNSSTRIGTAAVSPMRVRHVTRREVEQGVFGAMDVLLPIPGAEVCLPDNHTADLYVVTLQRFGLMFDPERAQWGCFYGRPHQHHHSRRDGHVNRDGSFRDHDGASSSSSAVSRFSSLRHASCPALHPSFALMEDELVTRTPFSEPLPLPSASAESTTVSAASWRADLRPQEGNPLQLHIPATYRHPLMNPAPTLQWRFCEGGVVDPVARWGSIMSHTLPRACSSSSSPSSFSSSCMVMDMCASLLPPSCDSKTHSAHVMNSTKGERHWVGREGVAGGSVTHDSTTSSLSSLAVSLAPTTTANSSSNNNSVTPSARSRSVCYHPFRPRYYTAAMAFAASSPAAAATLARTPRHKRPRVRPATPYWLPQHRDNCLRMRVVLPAGVYPSMMLRELTKSDVNQRDVVDVDGRSLPTSGRVRPVSWGEGGTV